MTVTISKLFDDHASASRAVGELEAAGVPRSEISVVASNADSWYESGDHATDTKKSRGITRPTQKKRIASIGMPMVLMTARKAPVQELASVRQSGALQDCSPALASWRYQASGPSLRPDGWWQRLLARSRARRLAVSSVP
jgi:hypothetical protein